MTKAIGILGLIKACSQNSQMSLDIIIKEISEKVETNFTKNMEIERRQQDLEEKFDSQNECIIRIINAINYLYQYWDYFLAIKAACECNKLLDIASMKAAYAHKQLVAYNRSVKWTDGSVSKETVTRVINAAKELTSIAT